MKVLKLKEGECIPCDYTGKIIWYNGNESWWKFGRRHRVNGAARSFPSGAKYYYLDGTEYEKSKWFEKLTPVQKIEAIFEMALEGDYV